MSLNANFGGKFNFVFFRYYILGAMFGNGPTGNHFNSIQFIIFFAYQICMHFFAVLGIVYVSSAASREVSFDWKWWISGKGLGQRDQKSRIFYRPCLIKTSILFLERENRDLRPQTPQHNDWRRSKTKAHWNLVATDAS